ncbi:hypothetical protein FN846DRAFT_960476 [Sphaerosporella brunnea]|uniref:Secreted protein n=1 Tax=Sphaerosporella brunnea TaxID=1250544 RepID=A0A5J5EQD4_9PEZI|nr:hypothetical protein FN846DRAFT_960476 [Sphaerosporella brunnea]
MSGVRVLVLALLARSTGSLPPLVLGPAGRQNRRQRCHLTSCLPGGLAATLCLRLVFGGSLHPPNLACVRLAAPFSQR